MTSFTSRNQRLARAGIAAAVALCGCLIANGASAGQPASVTVSFADLDLSKPAGAQTLYKRIEAAARRVCGPVDGYRDVVAQRSLRTCFATAIADAVTQLDRPSLTSLHREGTSRTARI